MTYIGDKILNYRFKRAKKKAIELKLVTKKKHVIIVDEKRKFHVINKETIKKLNEKQRKKKIKNNFTWQYVLNAAIYSTN